MLNPPTILPPTWRQEDRGFGLLRRGGAHDAWPVLFHHRHLVALDVREGHVAAPLLRLLAATGAAFRTPPAAARGGGRALHRPHFGLMPFK